MKQKIFIFALAFIMLLGALPMKEVKADEYMPVWDYITAFDFSYVESEYLTEEYMDIYPYYMCFYSVAAKGYYLIVMKNVPEFVYNSDEGKLYFSGHEGYAFVYEEDKTFRTSRNSTGEYMASTGAQINYLDFMLPNIEGIENMPDTIGLNPDFYDSHVHEWILYTEDATCTETGRSWEQCICRSKQNETIIDAIGHTWEKKKEEGSCLEGGKSWDECIVCNVVQNEIYIEALGHIYDDDNDYYCNVCSYNRNIDRSINFMDMLPIILTLFLVFPLNVFLIIQVVVLSCIVYRRIKKS